MDELIDRRALVCRQGDPVGLAALVDNPQGVCPDVHGCDEAGLGVFQGRATWAEAPIMESNMRRPSRPRTISRAMSREPFGIQVSPSGAATITIE